MNEKENETPRSYNRRAAAMKTLVEMMEGATPEQVEALAIAATAVWKREREKLRNRARRNAAKMEAVNDKGVSSATEM